jgi:hypothetical protein
MHSAYHKPRFDDFCTSEVEKFIEILPPDETLIFQYLIIEPFYEYDLSYEALHVLFSS